MRKLGIMLTVLGIIWGFVAFNMQTTIVTEEKTIGRGEYAITVPSVEINNIGLLDRRRTHLLMACALAVVGVLLFGFSTLQTFKVERTGVIDDQMKCPFCAESIQKAAIKCRHCGSEIKNDVFLPKTSHDPEASFLRPLPEEPKRKMKTIIAVVSIAAVMLIWVGFFPTTVSMDHNICMKKASLSSFSDGADRTSIDGQIKAGQSRQNFVKECMVGKGHTVKTTALKSDKNLADVRAMLAAATDTNEREMYKRLVEIQESVLEAEQLAVFDKADNWQ